MPEYDDSLIVQKVFVQGQFTFEEGLELHFRNCDFQQVSISIGIDWIFEHCNFDACDFSSSELQRSSFLYCNFDGCVFSETNLDESQFLGCNFRDPPQFNTCQLYGAAFIDTDIFDAALLGCDARYITVQGCGVSGATFDDTDFTDADLSGARGLIDSQLTAAEGNSRTKLPDGVSRPDDWVIDEDESSAQYSGIIPGQISAPLKVIWRNDKLTPDPRGTPDDQWKNPSITAIFYALQAEVSLFLENHPTNHSISRHIKSISDAMRHGLSGLNPVSVGFQIELIKANLPSAEDELSNSTIGAIKAIVSGGEILVSQFSEWRDVAALREATESDRENLYQVANAIRSLAASIKSKPTLFDNRIYQTLESQAEGVEVAIGNARVQTGAARSSANVLSALASRWWGIAKSGASVAGQEALKQLIQAFFKSNQLEIEKLISWAPSALTWLKSFLSGL